MTAPAGTLSPTTPDSLRPGSTAPLRPTLLRPSTTSALVSLLLVGAVFGFFYAWVCSTMWGLDATDPRVAIQAMQSMNASVRNPVFFPAFFLPPVALGGTALLAWNERSRHAATAFGIAALLYAVGGIGLTTTVNIPMNEALAATPVPASLEEARVIWSDYSDRWQTFNQIRTAVSGVALLLTGWGLLLLGRGRG